MKSKNLKLTDEQVKFIAENKKHFPSEQFFISKAIDHFIAHIKKERYDKMINQLNLKQYDTD